MSRKMHAKVHGDEDHDSTVKLALPYWMKSFWGVRVAGRAGTAKRVYIMPIHIPRDMTIDEIQIFLETGSSGKSCRIGLYKDNGGTPNGGALLYDSGNISVATAGALVVNPTPIALTKGIVWAAVASEDTVQAFSADTGTYMPLKSTGSHPMFGGCRYDLGTFGALTDPCPTVTQDLYGRILFFVHVASVDD